MSKKLLSAVVIIAVSLFLGMVSSSMAYEAAEYFPLQFGFDSYGSTGYGSYEDYIYDFDEKTGIFNYVYDGDSYREELYANSVNGFLMYGFVDYTSGSPVVVSFFDPETLNPDPLVFLPATFSVGQPYNSNTAFTYGVEGGGTATGSIYCTTIVREEAEFTNNNGMTFNNVLKVSIALSMRDSDGVEFGREQRVYWLEKGVGPLQIEFNIWDGYSFYNNEMHYLQESSVPYGDTGFAKTYFDASNGNTYQYYNEDWQSGYRFSYEGRTYKEAGYDYDDNDNAVPYEETTYAYAMDSATPLITHEANMSSIFGDGTVYLFYNNGVYSGPTAARVEFSSGAVAEVVIVDEDSEYITKVTYADSTGTAWFMWDSENQLVDIVQRDNFGNWSNWICDYGLVLANDPGIDLKSYVANPIYWDLMSDNIGPQDMSALELGDWWRWAGLNNIVPEFPALSTTYTYDQQNPSLVIEMVHHNDFLDTKYVFDWSNSCKVSIYYDYNDDGRDELIGQRVYDNNGDYDLNNLDNWPSISEVSYLNGCDIIVDFGATNGFWRYSNDRWTKLRSGSPDSFVLSEANSGGYYEGIADFGQNGLWKYSNHQWDQLSTWDAESFMISDQDSSSYDIVGDFGLNGVWHYSNSQWNQLSVWDPDSFALSESNGGCYDGIGDFGTNGLWKYSGGQWNQLSVWDADMFLLSDLYNGSYDIIGDFAGNGLWQYSVGQWNQLSVWDADTVLLSQLNSGSYDVVGDFGGSGLWQYSGGQWNQLSVWDASTVKLSGINSGSYDLLSDFEDNGLWKYSGGEWEQLSLWNADSFKLSEIANGSYDAIGDFGNNGLWQYSNGSWSQLSVWDADSFRLSTSTLEGAYDIIADFGSNGLWKHSGDQWTQLSTWDADPEVSQMLEVNSQVRRYGKTTEGGFTFTSALANNPITPLGQQPQ